MTTLYGIPNCATVKKARAWLSEKQVPHAFVNFKTEANRKGTTWRKLSPAEQTAADSREGAIALMQAQPSVIKRPVLEHQGRVHIGFSPERYSEIFA